MPPTSQPWSQQFNPSAFDWSKMFAPQSGNPGGISPPKTGGGFQGFNYDPMGGFRQTKGFEPTAGGLRFFEREDPARPTMGQLGQQIAFSDYGNLLAGVKEAKARLGGVANQMGQDTRRGAGAMVGQGMKDAQGVQELGRTGAGWEGKTQAGWDEVMKGVDKGFGEGAQFLKDSYATTKGQMAGAEAGLQAAIEKSDFGRQDIVAANVEGAHANLRSQMDAINKDPSLDPGQKAGMIDQLKRDTQMQVARVVPQLQKEGEDAALAAQQAMAQLRSMNAGSLGGIGLGTGQALMQGAGQRAQFAAQGVGEVQRAREAGSQFMQASNQYASSLRQQVLAQATQFLMGGNQTMYQMYSEMPYSAPALLPTLIAGAQFAESGVGGQVPGEQFAQNLFKKVS